MRLTTVVIGESSPVRSPESGFSDTESEEAPQPLHRGPSARSNPKSPVSLAGGSLGCLWASWWVVGVDDFVAGFGFDDDVAAVVDVVVTHGAGQTHGVDVG